MVTLNQPKGATISDLTKATAAAFLGSISEIQAISSDMAGRTFRATVDHPGIGVWGNAVKTLPPVA